MATANELSEAVEFQPKWKNEKLKNTELSGAASRAGFLPPEEEPMPGEGRVKRPLPSETYSQGGVSLFAEAVGFVAGRLCCFPVLGWLSCWEQVPHKPSTKRQRRATAFQRGSAEGRL